jgi:predicted deacylase
MEIRKKDGSAPQQYAYNLLHRLVLKFKYLIDLHTASKGRVNSLYVRADMLDARTRRMALLQNPQVLPTQPNPSTPSTDR